MYILLLPKHHPSRSHNQLFKIVREAPAVAASLQEVTVQGLLGRKSSQHMFLLRCHLSQTNTCTASTASQHLVCLDQPADHWPAWQCKPSFGVEHVRLGAECSQLVAVTAGFLVVSHSKVTFGV